MNIVVTFCVTFRVFSAPEVTSKEEIETPTSLKRPSKPLKSAETADPLDAFFVKRGASQGARNHGSHGSHGQGAQIPALCAIRCVVSSS